MEELSIEQKAKHYDEAIKRAKELLEIGVKDTRDKRVVLSFFPELKESDDERIVKCLLNYFHHVRYNGLDLKGTDVEEVIAWLEKQGEQKPVEWHREDEQNLNVCLGYIPDELLKRWLKDIIHIKYDKSSDKVEPKFNLYDWVVTDKGDTVQIGAVNNGYYTLCNGMDFNMSYVDKCWHKWTNKDAKDGDVLVYGDNPDDHHVEVIMIFKSLRDDKQSAFTHFHIFDNNFRIDDWCDCGKNVHPATKEQRDLLFTKMKDAGYEWNKDKKKLIKL